MSDFLGALGTADREALLAAGARRRYHRGEVIYREHDDAGGALVLLEGHVTASTSDAEGREVILGMAGPGDLVGELSALRGTPRSATVTAREDVVALALPGADFRHFLRTAPEAAVFVLDTVVERLQVADAHRLELASLDVVARVSRRLLELSERVGEANADGAVDVAVTQEELAAWAGASRESVSKALHVLRTLGCVETGRRRIAVLDEAALRRRAV
jgi:CRP/FNR family transcriptional regulator, cyclic AMP receptor protein